MIFERVYEFLHSKARKSFLEAAVKILCPFLWKINKIPISRERPAGINPASCESLEEVLIG